MNSLNTTDDKNVCQRFAEHVFHATYALIVPLAILNLLCGTSSGIWLAVLGEWGAIIYGLFGIFLSGTALGLIQRPFTVLLEPLILNFAIKGRVISSRAMLLLYGLCTGVVIAIWCYVVFIGYIQRATPKSFFPMAFWSYSVATGPLIYHALRKRARVSLTPQLYPLDMYAIFAQIGYAAMILAYYSTTALSKLDVLVAFAFAMVIAPLTYYGFRFDHRLDY